MKAGGVKFDREPGEDGTAPAGTFHEMKAGPQKSLN